MDPIVVVVKAGRVTGIGSDGCFLRFWVLFVVALAFCPWEKDPEKVSVEWRSVLRRS